MGPTPRNGSEAEAAMRPELEHALHLGLLNRGVLVTPFHNMMLASPVTTEAQVGPAARCARRLPRGAAMSGKALQ